MIHFLYKTTCTINGKYYIGRHSCKKIDSYLGSGIWISRSIRKYGKHNFIREIVSYWPNIPILKIEEEKLIASHKNNLLCMNFSPHSSGGWDYVNSVVLPRLKEEGKYKRPDTSGSKNPMFGKKQKESSKILARNKLKAKYSTPEWKLKHRLIQLELNRKATLEERIAMSVAQLMIVHTDQRNSKISESLKGRPSGTAGRIWINNCKCNLAIDKSHLSYYTERGWKIGKIVTIDSSVSLPHGLKNIMMVNKDLQIKKRVRSGREYEALLSANWTYE